MLTRGSKGRDGESDVLQVQSDYSNTFNWGPKEHAVLAGVTITTTTPSATSYANTTPAPRPSWARPTTAPRWWMAAPRCSGTPSRRATWDCMRKTPVLLTNTLKLVGGLRYDDFSASYRNPGTISNKISTAWSAPRRPDLPAR